MFKPTTAYFCFSVDNLAKAKAFYAETLGVEVEELTGRLRLHLPGGSIAIAYVKDSHQPTTYTILDFVVDDIDEAVDELTKRDVQFEHLKDLPISQDEKGIMRGRSHNLGPDIAWFKDSAGNVLAVLQQPE
jgi:catechol 2,3-dioxygenase-like lactoylglutathione lyase family enzyme